MAITKVSSELIKDNSITMDKMHTGVVITTSEGLHNNANDTVLPTAGAVAAYVTSQVTGADNWDLAFAWGDHSTYGYATETYVDNSIANVINSAPAALDTLNELAAALGDDPNFATTVTNLIAGKQAAGTYNTIIGTDTDIDTSGATIVDNIYVTDGVITSMGTRTLTLGDLGYTGATNANYITNNNQLTNGAGYITSFDITTQTDSKYLRSNADDTTSGDLTISKSYPKLSLYDTANTVSTRPSIEWETTANQGVAMSMSVFDSELPEAGYGLIVGPSSTNAQWPSTGNLSFNVLGEIYAGSESLGSVNKVWHAGNDGSGSGLDADLLDGVQGSAYIKENEDRRYKAIRFTGEGGNSSNPVINYGIYQEGGAWSSPFPDLVIGYHTGIKIGGYKNYNGTRFYNDAPGRSGASMILSVGDNSDDVVATSSLRAPIFYDSDNTAYYLNPAGTSVLNYVSVHRIYGVDGNVEVLGHLEFQDNQNVRLGNGADFRMWHDGSHHYFRNYNHAAGDIYFQGEDTEGTNHALLYMITATSRPHIRLYENGGERLRTTSAGIDVYGALTATGDITAFSDKRVKGNIETIPDALEKVKELNGVTFTRTDAEDKDRRHTGVIAQDVLKVLPEAVIGNEDEGMLSVAYGNMVGLLIEAIKEQQAQIDELKQLINKQ